VTVAGAPRHALGEVCGEVGPHQLVRICPEDGTVLDPFTGSGSTGVAALREGRHFIGVEPSDHYAAVAERRLQAELAQDDFILAGPEE
jgi:site-specific DNA-methyltransferase (adenine-specific)